MKIIVEGSEGEDCEYGKSLLKYFVVSSSTVVPGQDLEAGVAGVAAAPRIAATVPGHTPAIAPDLVPGRDPRTMVMRGGAGRTAAASPEASLLHRSGIAHEAEAEVAANPQTGRTTPMKWCLVTLRSNSRLRKKVAVWIVHGVALGRGRGSTVVLLKRMRRCAQEVPLLLSRMMWMNRHLLCDSIYVQCLEEFKDIPWKTYTHKVYILCTHPTVLCMLFYHNFFPPCAIFMNVSHASLCSSPAPLARPLQDINMAEGDRFLELEADTAPLHTETRKREHYSLACLWDEIK